MKNQPSYYGIIPASVRYDNKIPPRAKLLYSEITALSNKEGYCFASNGYFADLYEVAEGSISRLLSQLAKRDHLRIEVTKNEKGTSRKIYPLDKIVKGGTQKCERGITKTLDGYNKNVQHNNKTNNKDNNSIGENSKIKDLERELKELKEQLKQQEKPKQKRSRFIAPTLEAAIEYFATKNSNQQEAEKFWYFYESKGWMVGKNKMQKWKASAGQWISRNKPAATPQKINLSEQYKSHLSKYLNEKQLKLMNGKIQTLLSKAGENAVQAKIKGLKWEYGDIKNKTFTEALIFDVCYGTLSACGTKPERRISKFFQWFNSLSDYKKNQWDLRKEFKTHISK